MQKEKNNLLYELELDLKLLNNGVNNLSEDVKNLKNKIAKKEKILKELLKMHNDCAK